MNKFLFVLFFLLVSVGILYGALKVFASPMDMNINPFGGTKMESPITSVTNTNGSLIALLLTGVRWLYTLFFIFAVVMILVAAYNFARGGGNEKLVETAKKQLKWAAVGIVVALSASGITWLVEGVLVGDINSPPPKGNTPLPMNYPSPTVPLQPVQDTTQKPPFIP